MSGPGEPEYDDYIRETRVFKDSVFFAVHDFSLHEKDCMECSGETETGVCGRGEYLCSEGRRILSWWLNEPAFIVTRLVHKCPNCGLETQT